jgi:hypothetical protein
VKPLIKPIIEKWFHFIVIMTGQYYSVPVLADKLEKRFRMTHVPLVIGGYEFYYLPKDRMILMKKGQLEYVLMYYNDFILCRIKD